MCGSIRKTYCADIRVIKMKHCKMTISLEEQVAQWVRAEASRRRVSVSRFLSEIVSERMLPGDSYERAMRRALARKPFLKTTRGYASRDDAHRRTHKS
jgi:hypothetical protein